MSFININLSKKHEKIKLGNSFLKERTNESKSDTHQNEINPFRC